MSLVLPSQPLRVGFSRRRRIHAAVKEANRLKSLKPGELRLALQDLAEECAPVPHERAVRLREEVLSVSPACRGRNACLTRSIAVALLCRLDGEWPTWCVGVLVTPPFTAHAWIEAEGQVVGEELAIGDYQSFYKVSPGRALAAAAAAIQSSAESPGSAVDDDIIERR
ncbi:lasso peptide biosynthesis B2 protein [Brevibacterium luteolum]|uniref:lasso peptide biosynthesis B2 protein n=1 Tax=Brevibacterium luteolum TaxID=199591 RepID=UPI001C24C5AB|nr:lasso peptide biosynthesis B2 protein [Brevibacterium luteolum]MBU8579696.1 lasso peptide biosynthesis B2 protein [Brevibacterium luteolum]